MNNQILLAENQLRKGLITIEQLCEVCQKFTLEEINEVSTFLHTAKKRLSNYLTARPKLKFPIKKYISEKLYTDVRAYEVIRQVSPNVVEIRELRTEIVERPKEFYAGGFVGHFADNYNQSYNYFSEERNQIIRLNLSKNGWGKGRFTMRDTPYKFYDFNF